MRTSLYIAISALVLICGCKKSGPNNYTCTVNSQILTDNVPSVITGNATAIYSTTTGYFQVIMSGPNSQSVVLQWAHVDSATGVKTINKSYVTNYQYADFSVTGTYVSQFTSGTYTTNEPKLAAGNITILSNTGVGGNISGTFYFTGENTSPPNDTVNISKGTFTNVPVVSQ